LQSIPKIKYVKLDVPITTPMTALICWDKNIKEVLENLSKPVIGR
jgi:hypothetical protein